MFMLVHCTLARVAWRFLSPSEDSITMLAQIKSESILDEAALHDVWTLLEEFSKHEDDVLKINYDGFSQVRRGWRSGVQGVWYVPCVCLVVCNRALTWTIGMLAQVQVATRAREMFGPVVDSCFRASLFARFCQARVCSAAMCKAAQTCTQKKTSPMLCV
jgi:hypothetical protein